ncbi:MULTISPECIES: hypothetical protein [unclassified Nitratiruptor]|uniref:hypothetical protein n=1 Tax=unclassified Nitratiruptor TaxID=2624044 RepID=UPI001914FBE2|nr:MULTISPECIES: hypothetical protein [unclassified Nitratiruptor]BCD60041.1 hypothetical protein NitYY0810_C0804 [Nitratiruptor sp. YY08-10]BCD63961.1 hypothetical protein NitYY0814_C0800 [Nitratiruptor sp. YY08-14]BCD64470.1 hypothetical protein NitYY0814_C1317 [Nitratiruptor sp. YY08-14]
MTKKELIVLIQELDLDPKVEKEIIKIAKLPKSLNVDYYRVLSMFLEAKAINDVQYKKMIDYFIRYFNGEIF